MNTSISVVLYRSKTLANGENPLMIQVSKNGKRKYQSLGISVNQEYWDFKKNRPKPNCLNREHIQQIILNKESELQKQVLNFGVEEKQFSAGNKLKTNNPFEELEKIIIAEMRSDLKTNSFS